jgi:hypothetical protein
MDRSENSRPRFVFGQSSFGKMMVLKSDWDFLESGRCLTEEGFTDWPLAAETGIRIFLFVALDWLKDNPEALEFVSGTWDDLDAIIGGGKIHLSDEERWILNPLQNVWKMNIEESPHLAISRVTKEEFHTAFGPKRFTSRFQKEKGV